MQQHGGQEIENEQFHVKQYEESIQQTIHTMILSPKNQNFLQYCDIHNESLIQQQFEHQVQNIDDYHKDNQFYYNADRPICSYTKYSKNSTVDRWLLYWPNEAYCLYSSCKLLNGELMPIATVCFVEKDVWVDDGTIIRVAYSGSGWANNKFRGKRVASIPWHIQLAYLKEKGVKYLYGLIQSGNESSLKATQRTNTVPYGNIRVRYNGYYVTTSDHTVNNNTINYSMLNTPEEFEKHIYEVYGKRSMVPCDLQKLYVTPRMVGHYVARDNSNVASFTVWKMVSVQQRTIGQDYPGYLIVNLSAIGHNSLRLLTNLIECVERELLKSSNTQRLFICICTIPSHDGPLYQTVWNFIKLNRNKDPEKYPVCDNETCFVIQDLIKETSSPEIPLFIGYTSDHNPGSDRRFFYDPRDCGNKPMYTVAVDQSLTTSRL
jgi:hypothetical protein